MSTADKKIDNLIDEHDVIKKELVELGMTSKVSEVDTRLDIPSIGNVNVLKIDEPNRECSFVFTDLESAQAFEFFRGSVDTAYGETVGRVCPATLKFLGHWKNYDKRGSKAEVFLLISSPYLVRRGVRVDLVGVNLTDEDIQLGGRAYTDSIATKAIDAFLLEREMRIDAEERHDNVRANVYYHGSKMGAGVVDDADLGIQDFSRQTDGEAFKPLVELWSWIRKNKLMAGIGIACGIYILGRFLGWF